MNKDDIFNPNVFTKVVAYGRVSTLKQRDNWSEDSQKEFYQKLRDEFNWGDEEMLYECGSGTSLRFRPKLKALLDRIENNDGDGIKAIFVVEQDRLTRPEEEYDYARICSTLKEYDIKLVIQRTVIDRSDDFGDTLFDINSMMAKQYRRVLLRNMKRGKDQKGRSGRNACGSPPDGYLLEINVITKKSGKYIPDPDRAYIILLIFELADQDKTVREIKKELESRGIPSPRRGKQGWSTSHIFDVLHNRQYLGIYIQGHTKSVKERGCKLKKVKLDKPEIEVGTEDAPNHPPLVPKELFYRVQEKLKLRKKKEKHGFELLTGIGVCYQCGELMRVNYGGSGKKCYVCKNKMKKGVGCSCKWLMVNMANPMVYSKFCALMERPLLIRELYRAGNINTTLINDQESLKKTYQKELSSAQDKIRRILDLHIDGRFSKAELDERLEGIRSSANFLEENIRRVNESLKTLQNTPHDPTEQLVKTILAIRFSKNKFTEEQKNRVFRKLVYRVPFHNDRFEFDIQFYQDPLRDLPANLYSSHF